MYARVITSQYQLDKLDEGIQLYRESILPELKQLPGSKGFTLHFFCKMVHRLSRGVD